MIPSRLAILARYTIRSTVWIWVTLGVVAAVVATKAQSPDSVLTAGSLWWRTLPDLLMMTFGFYMGMSARKRGYNQCLRGVTALEQILAMLSPIIPLIMVVAASSWIWTDISSWQISQWLSQSTIIYGCAMVVGLRSVRWTRLAPLLSIQGLFLIQVFWTEGLTSVFGLGMIMHSLVFLGDAVWVVMVCWWAWSLLRSAGDGRDDVPHTRLPMASMLVLAGLGLWMIIAMFTRESEIGGFIVAHARPPALAALAWLDPHVHALVYSNLAIGGGTFLTIASILGIISSCILGSYLLGRHRGLPTKSQVAWMFVAGAIGPISLLAQLAIQYPAPRRTCPGCGTSRWADDHHCAACAAPWGDPPRDSRALLNPA